MAASAVAMGGSPAHFRTTFGDATNLGKVPSSSKHALQLDEVGLSPPRRRQGQRDNVYRSQAASSSSWEALAGDGTLECASDCSTVSAQSSPSHSYVEDEANEVGETRASRVLRRNKEGRKAVPVFFGTPSNDERERRAKYKNNNLSRRLLRTDSLDLARRRSIVPSQEDEEMRTQMPEKSTGVTSSSSEGHLNNHDEEEVAYTSGLDIQDEEPSDSTNSGDKELSGALTAISVGAEPVLSQVEMLSDVRSPLRSRLKDLHLTETTPRARAEGQDGNASTRVSPPTSARKSPSKHFHDLTCEVSPKSQRARSPTATPLRRSPKKELKSVQTAPATPTVRDMLKSWAATIVQSPNKSPTRTSPRKMPVDSGVELTGTHDYFLQLARRVPLPESPEKREQEQAGISTMNAPTPKDADLSRKPLQLQNPYGVPSAKRIGSRSIAGPSARLASNLPKKHSAPSVQPSKESDKGRHVMPDTTKIVRQVSRLPVPASHAVKRSGIPVGRPTSSSTLSDSASSSSSSVVSDRKGTVPNSTKKSGLSRASEIRPRDLGNDGNLERATSVPTKSTIPLQKPKTASQFQERRAAIVRGSSSSESRSNGPFPPSHGKSAILTQPREQPSYLPPKILLAPSEERSMLSASASQVEQLLAVESVVSKPTPSVVPPARSKASRDPRLAHTKPATRVWDSPKKRGEPRSPQRIVSKTSSPIRSMPPPPRPLATNVSASMPSLNPSLPFSSGSGRARRVLLHSSETATTSPRPAARATLESRESVRPIARFGRGASKTGTSSESATSSERNEETVGAIVEVDREERMVESALLPQMGDLPQKTSTEGAGEFDEEDESGAIDEEQRDLSASINAQSVAHGAGSSATNPYRHARPLASQKGTTRPSIFAVAAPSTVIVRPLSQAEWSQKTKINTRRNEKSCVTIDILTIHKSGERPPSPSSKFVKGQSPGQELKNRKRICSFDASSDDEDEWESSAEEIEDHLCSVSRHRLRAGEEVRYETPPRIRYAPEGRKAVRWQKDIFQGPASSLPSSKNRSDLLKSCLAPSVHDLDRFGNIAGAEQPLPSRLVAKQKVIVHRIVYDGEDED